MCTHTQPIPTSNYCYTELSIPKFSLEYTICMFCKHTDFIIFKIYVCVCVSKHIFTEANDSVRFPGAGVMVEVLPDVSARS